MTTRLALALALLLSLAPGRAQAQGPWSVLITGGAVGFSDAAKATVPEINEPEAFEASSTTRLRIGVERDLGRFGVRFAYGYAEAGLGSSGDVSVTFLPALTLHEVTLQAVYRVVGIPSGPSVTVRGGPMTQLWDGEVIDDIRVRWGAQAGVTVDAPLLSDLTLLADVSLGAAGSFLEDSDLDPLNVSYERTTVWTRELAVGLRLRF